MQALTDTNIYSLGCYTGSEVAMREKRGDGGSNAWQGRSVAPAAHACCQCARRFLFQEG